MWKTILAGMPRFQPSLLAQQVIRLLISDPDGWELDTYLLTHAKTGIAIWIANEDYGLHLEMNGQRTNLSQRDRKAIYAAAKPNERAAASVLESALAF